MPQANDVERRIREADRVLAECRRRQIDPVQALREAIKRHDRQHKRQPANW